MKKFKETSLSIEPKIKAEIDYAADITGKSGSFLVKKLISRVILIDSNVIITEGLTEYQERYNDKKLIFRYRVSDSEHFLFSSARLKYNISVSKLLLIGYFLFFKKLINKYKKNNKSKIKWYNYYSISFKFSYIVQKFFNKIQIKQHDYGL